MVVTFRDLGNYGRLGNAMFQLSSTISLALRNNDNFLFPQWPFSSFFNIPEDRFVEKLPACSDYHEPFFHYQSIPYKKNLNLVGYFQSEKYFKDCEGEIRKYLKPKNLQLPVLTDVAGLHVRRSDYLTHINCFEILGMDYYERAMEKCNSTRYMIFSDDIKWCKENFKGNRYIFVEGNNAITDLFLMSRCTNNIIANSSFSWWAAYLNDNPGKMVIAPKKWFGPELAKTHDTKDLIPEEWIRI